MKPTEHLLVSLGLGAWRAARRRDAGVLGRTILGGVLIDLDHLPDYVLRVATRRYLIVLPLHGFDVLLAIWLVGRVFLPAGRRTALGDVLLGAFVHLAADQLANEAFPYSYVLLARIGRGFEHDRLFRPKPMASWQQVVRKGFGLPGAGTGDGG